MACIAINIGYWVAVYLTCRRTSTISNMAGITAYTCSHDIRTGMVRVGIQKAGCSVTGTAFRTGIRVTAALEDGGRFTNGHRAVVATETSADYIRMIKAAVQCNAQEAGGIVAVIAFSIRRCMKFRFTDSRHPIMAFAALTKNFLMISKRNNGCTLGCMTGLTHITGCDVIR